MCFLWCNQDERICTELLSQYTYPHPNNLLDWYTKSLRDLLCIVYWGKWFSLQIQAKSNYSSITMQWSELPFHRSPDVHPSSPLIDHMSITWCQRREVAGPPQQLQVLNRHRLRQMELRGGDLENVPHPLNQPRRWRNMRESQFVKVFQRYRYLAVPIPLHLRPLPLHQGQQHQQKLKEKLK